jgi:type IV pilus assembly protein PilC
LAPQFKYEVRDKNGVFSSGVIEAETEETVEGRLRDQGYYIVSLEEKKDRNFEIDLTRFTRVKLKDLALFSRQFATMIKAGLSLVRSLKILSVQLGNPKLKEAVIEVREDIEEGKSLSEALNEHPDVFPQIFTSMVEAGEVGGILDGVLEELADYFEQQHELNQKVKSALSYPAVISLVAIGVILVLVFKVLPEFVSIFSGLGVDLPAITQFMLGASDFLSNYWLFLMLIVGVLGTGSYFYYNSDDGRERIDNMLLKLPLVGDLLIKVSIARFTKTLGVLLASGVSILESLRIVSTIVSNQVVANKLNDARRNISEGESITGPLSEAGIFPAMVIQMIRVGEETGDLEGMLAKIADFYEVEVEHKIESMVSMIEPLLIVVMAVVVGAIAMAILFPMFEMIQGV